MKEQNQKNIFRLANWLIITFVFSSCAQIVNPNGGPKDVSPPQAVKYFPDSAKTNFSAKNITIVFDEYIQLNDLQKQLVISPPMNVQPEVKAKGKTLIIELNDSLKKNTTYTFNFGDAIRDFTEGNALENFQYVFSTGSYIDSLQLSGTVKNAFDLKTEKGILVMLYDTHDDSVPCKKLPSYFAKTNTSGTYKINHIRTGTYKAFALKDANNNYLYDAQTENIAFSDTLITIRKNSSLDLQLFTEEPGKQKLKKSYFAEHGHLVFAFAKPTNDSLKLHFFSQEPKENMFYEYSKNTDTLHYWFADDFKDTMKIQINQGNKILDTVRLKPITLEQMSKSSRGEKWGLRVKTNVSKDKSFDLNKPVMLILSHPLNYQTKDFTKQEYDSIMLKFGNRIIFNENSIRMSIDSISIPFFNRPIKIRKQKNSSWTTGNIAQSLFEYKNWKENTSYSIFLPPATFTDIFGLTNDTIKLDFKTQEEKYYGILKLSLKMKSNAKYILHLMNEKGEVFDYANSDRGIFSYTYLPPGSYKIRIIYDTNGDDKWTTGNYSEKKKPETVIYYPSPITIRSNWDLELEWKVE